MADEKKGPSFWEVALKGTLVGALLGAVAGFAIVGLGSIPSGPPRALAAGERVWLPSFSLYTDEGGQRSIVQEGQYLTLLRQSRWLNDRWLVRLESGSEGWVDVPPGASA